MLCAFAVCCLLFNDGGTEVNWGSCIYPQRLIICSQPSWLPISLSRFASLSHNRALSSFKATGSVRQYALDSCQPIWLKNPTCKCVINIRAAQADPRPFMQQHRLGVSSHFCSKGALVLGHWRGEERRGKEKRRQEKRPRQLTRYRHCGLAVREGDAQHQAHTARPFGPASIHPSWLLLRAQEGR